MGFSKFFERCRTSIILRSLTLAVLVVRADFLWAQDTVRVLALGDSLTAGYKLPKDQAFSALIEKSLKAQGYSVEVVNAGVSGDTARQALSRLDWTLKRAGPFQVAIIGLGANDGLRRSDVSQMRDALEKIITRLKTDEGMDVYLLGMRLPLNWEKVYRTSFEATYPALSKKHSVALYPFILEGLALNDAYNLEDRIHPNPAGHALIAKNLEAWLMKDAKFRRRITKK